MRFLKELVFSLVIIGLVTSTEDISAFMLGDADPFLNNIWLEPRDPIPGDIVSINSSIYNQGTQSTNSVTDVVTVGYFLDGNLIKIDTLPDVVPGEDNGVKIATGPIWTAIDGIHTITVILNYHDTLSHLTDNLENNIMQKIYYIGDWENPNPRISAKLFQEYIQDKYNQDIQITGEVDLPLDVLKSNPKVIIQFDNSDGYNDGGNFKQHYTVPIDLDTRSFYFKETLQYFQTTTPITISYFTDRDESYEYKLQTYPIKLEENNSAWILQESTDSFRSQKFLVAIYDESYNLIKKIETYNIPDITTQNTVNSFVSVILPGDQLYNMEVYSEEGNLIYASSKFLHANNVVVDDLNQEWRESN
ncbi:hypothetical protein [Nitrosopumilus sp.]|uniref:hypothetical protein n=1 Tax=Nitrosopumilus sp. TaxID=2024843 RepID=UPI00292E0D38|nr:hypothetical protein [Nitrosopumilus sp.]